MEAIILAGGRGTRLQSVVPDLPKPMAPINGRPFLTYQLDYWIKQGVLRFILSVGYKRDAIQDYFKDRYKGIEIVYAVEEQPLGTGGGLLLALERIKNPSPFLVLNGDTFFEVDLEKLKSFHLEKKADLTMALLEVAENSRYGGVQLGEGERIVAYRGISNPSNRLINGGVYLFEKGALSDEWIPGSALSLEDQLFPVLLQSGSRVYGFKSAGRFIDIGIPDDYYASALMLGEID
ncbi:MAG: nucleotidyltransferase family protein [Nitrospirae bacterium]|nr:nucleotidyltransferase family protein [Candidatus Manganitrophaceae bacterium]